jgi:hypothetical protein
MTDPNLAYSVNLLLLILTGLILFTVAAYKQKEDAMHEKPIKDAQGRLETPSARKNRVSALLEGDKKGIEPKRAKKEQEVNQFIDETSKVVDWGTDSKGFSVKPRNGQGRLIE